MAALILPGILVFVYGTLKNGQPNYFWLQDHQNGASTFLANGKTNDRYPLIIGTRYNIPFLLDVLNMGHSINGEIYRINEAMLKNLDVLEDYPNFYLRHQINITDDDGIVHNCWTYFLKKYPDNFMENQTMISSYTSSKEMPYVPPADRDPFLPAEDDLDYRPPQQSAAMSASLIHTHRDIQ